MAGRFLITTAEESTWPTDGPALFLGEWCRLFARRHVWEKMDAVVTPYHWDDRDKFHSDYGYLQRRYEEILPELAASLNAMHGVGYSVRYWRILVGPWLGYFLQILFDRWTMVQRAINGFEVSGVRIVATPREWVVPNDMQEFVRFMVDDPWNEAIYGDVLRHCSGIAIEDVPGDSRRWAQPGTNAVVAAKTLLHRRAFRTFSNAVTILSRPLTRETDAFVMATSYPRGYELRVQARLGQLPRVWRPIPAPLSPISAAPRGWMLADDPGDSFMRVARKMLPRHMPRAYVEGYPQLRDQTRTHAWPSCPKLIFSSTSFSGDDVFKAWAASKAEAGTPLVIAQHGGGYGTSRVISNEDHEVRIADAYLSWGWDDAMQKHIRPAVCAKALRRPARHQASGSSALLVTVGYPRQSYKLTSEPLASQWLGYFEDQCAFVAQLPNVIRRALVVRLYNEDYGWSQKHRWIERFPDIQLDEGARPMAEIIGQARIFISTYNSTTFLESLSSNVPTIMFWNPNRWELRHDAVSYFDLLKHVGLLHDTPAAAAAKVATVWEDVPAWWNDAEITEARAIFCERFARSVPDPAGVLHACLSDVGPAAAAHAFH